MGTQWEWWHMGMSDWRIECRDQNLLSATMPFKTEMRLSQLRKMYRFLLMSRGFSLISDLESASLVVILARSNTTITSRSPDTSFSFFFWQKLLCACIRFSYFLPKGNNPFSRHCKTGQCQALCQGGVNSSSLEVLAALALTEEEWGDFEPTVS